MASSPTTARAPKNGLLHRLKSRVRAIDHREFNRVSTTSLRGVPAIIAIIAVGMTIFGCIMVLSASSVEMIAQQLSPFSQVSRQVFFGIIGLLTMVCCAFIPVTVYRRKGVLTILMALAILVQLAVVLMGKEVNGNRNWLEFGGIQIQPSEVSKLITILWMAYILKNQGDVSVGVGRVLHPVMWGVGPLVLMIIAGGDVGTVLIYGMFVFVMLWVSGLNKKASITFAVLGLFVAIAAMMSSANRRSRVLALFGVCNGSVCDQSNSGLAALASGGFWGVGLGRSRQKYNYLPEAHNDYIFAVIGEELGLIGSALVILFYLSLIYCAVRIITRSADRFVKLATTGILTWLVFQALVNIMMVTGLAPVIGVTLPFISYGGSSLISSLAAAGILIAFARQTPLQSIAGGLDAVETESPIYKDTERRMKLAKIVNQENAEYRRNGWAPAYVFPWQQIRSFFGAGTRNKRQKTTAPTSRRTQTQKRTAQPVRRRPVEQKNAKVRAVSETEVKKLQEVSEKSAERVEPTQPALRLVADVEETAGTAEAPQENAQVPYPEQQEPKKPAPQPSEPVRRIPPGLVPIRHGRKQQNDPKNHRF